uniref:Uncharacterized protein n=1 Tax=Octopus bimaculoides TaxID=37653 RepID=A0A0L8IFX0_OCTBM
MCASSYLACMCVKRPKSFLCSVIQKPVCISNAHLSRLYASVSHQMVQNLSLIRNVYVFKT